MYGVVFEHGPGKVPGFIEVDLDVEGTTVAILSHSDGIVLQSRQAGGSHGPPNIHRK